MLIPLDCKRSYAAECFTDCDSGGHHRDETLSDSPQDLTASEGNLLVRGNTSG